MLSGVLIKAVGAYSLIRILFNVLGFSPTFSLLLLTLGTLSMLLGALLALSQNDLKRMLAYSSISQIGYIFIGLGLGTPLGIMGGLFHLVNHATFKPLLFLNAGAIEYETGTRKLNELGGIAKVMPQANAAFTIGSFSIAGLPPFNGFWSKLFIIIALVGAGYYWVALLAVIASIITLSYFMIIQKRVFFGELSEKFKGVTDAPFAMTAPMWILAVICIAAGLGFPWVINNLITPAVLVLLNGCSYGGIL
jgi:multicomponent Na+:H+ antiporter subunit D